MNKAKKSKNVWLLVGILTAVFGVLGIPGLILSATHGLWLPMALCIALVVHAFYGTAMYFMAYANAGIRYRVCTAVETYGMRRAADIAAFARIPEENVEGVLDACLKREYLTSYIFRDGVVEDIGAPPPKQRKCAYCGTLFSADLGFCPACGAPRDTAEEVAPADETK